MTNSSGLGDRISPRCTGAKLWNFGFAIERPAGPDISGMTGFQIRSSPAQAAAHPERAIQRMRRLRLRESMFESGISEAKFPMVATDIGVQPQFPPKL